MTWGLVEGSAAKALDASSEVLVLNTMWLEAICNTSSKGLEVLCAIDSSVVPVLFLR